jgi:hypothetical protein
MIALGALLALLCVCRIHTAHCHVVVSSSSRRLKGGGGEMMKKGGGKMSGKAMMRRPSPARAPVRAPVKRTKAPAPENRRATYPYLTLVSPDALTFNPMLRNLDPSWAAPVSLSDFRSFLVFLRTCSKTSVTECLPHLQTLPKATAHKNNIITSESDNADSPILPSLQMTLVPPFLRAKELQEAKQSYRSLSSLYE